MRAIPIIISRVQRKTEIKRAKGTRSSKTEEKSELNTSKYSWSFIWVPTGSFIFIAPENMNNIPTKYLDKVYKILIFYELKVLLSKKLNS